jgi:RNA polymerase-binding transcription factor
MSSRAPHLNARLTDEFRRRLLESREALLRTVAATDEEMAELEAPGPGDSTDRAAAASTAELISRLGGHDKRGLDEVAAALGRLGSGAYGICGSCGKAIPLPRLRAMPAARFCLACQEAEEVVA